MLAILYKEMNANLVLIIVKNAAVKLNVKSVELDMSLIPVELAFLAHHHVVCVIQTRYTNV